MDIWNVYVDLVKSVVSGDLDLVLKQGVSDSVEWSSPAADYMFVRDKHSYIKARSGIAMFIASHRGNLHLAKNLFAHGMSILHWLLFHCCVKILKIVGGDINYQSSYGRTPIIISIVADQMKIMDFLLDSHADVETADTVGENAVTIAKRFNNKLAQHR